MIRRKEVMITKAADAEIGTYYVMCADVRYLLKHKGTGKIELQVAITTIHSIGDVMKQLQDYELVEDENL